MSALRHYFCPSRRGCSSVVEHLLAKEDVASSSLVTRSISFLSLLPRAAEGFTRHELKRMQSTLPAGLQITAEITHTFAEILTPDALAFVAKLQREFGARRGQALRARQDRQLRFDAGELPDFLSQTKKIRESDWSCAPIPNDLRDRRVEITGPTDRKMVINALNSGSSVFMADFEDANSPTWRNLMEG